MKLMVLVALCLSLTFVQAKDTEPSQPAAGIGVAVVVICVGGYCVYRVVKFCQRAFPPKSTNSNGGFMTIGTDEYAGAYEYSSVGSCWVSESLNAFPYEDLTKNPTTFTLNVIVENGAVSYIMKANNDEGTAQTWDQFAADMVWHGLYLTGHAQWQPQFARNGVPCDAFEVPLTFDQPTGRVTHNIGDEMRRVSIERSPNLTDWSPLMMTDVSDGAGFDVIDTTREGQMFYRVQVSQP